MKVRHYKHPDKLYTVIGTGIIAATSSRPINDMDKVTVYSAPRGGLWVCFGDYNPETGGYRVVTFDAKAQAREPLKIADAITVYRSDDDGSYWVRNTGEFNDGRFSADGSEATLLWQARYVLRDLHKKHSDCGYGKMAEACERAADRELGKCPA